MVMKKSTLVLVRHGQSEWNKKNLFTGWKDPGLTEQGIKEATEAGQHLNSLGLNFDVMYTSDLIRAQETGKIILEEMNQESIAIVKSQKLNERNYGDLAGLNKDDAREKWGEDQVHIWRRSFDVPPPGGESLKNTAERVLPYFRSEILPKIEEGSNVLIAAHGNSLRALVMELEKISPDKIVGLEISTGDPLIYECLDQSINRIN